MFAVLANLLVLAAFLLAIGGIGYSFGRSKDELSVRRSWKTVRVQVSLFILLGVPLAHCISFPFMPERYAEVRDYVSWEIVVATPAFLLIMMSLLYYVYRMILWGSRSKREG